MSIATNCIFNYYLLAWSLDMSPELDKKLCGAFPLLYADRHAGMMATCMCWGFECRDGWFQLIWNLSEKLEPLIQEWINQVPNEKHPTASQVKEKYGTLRFYMYGSTDKMDDLIDEAEELSEVTCEVCGESGELRGKSWLQTLCDKHWKESI